MLACTRETFSTVCQFTLNSSKMLRYLAIAGLWKVLAAVACTAAAPCSTYSESSPDYHDSTSSRVFSKPVYLCCSNHQHARHFRAANRVFGVSAYEPKYSQPATRRKDRETTQLHSTGGSLTTCYSITLSTLQTLSTVQKSAPKMYVEPVFARGLLGNNRHSRF